MNFVKDLIGGAVIIVAAGAIAIAQNAFRSDRIPLVPRNSAPRAEAQSTPSSENNSPAPENASPPLSTSTERTGSEVPSQGAPAAAESPAGEVTTDRLRELLQQPGVVIVDARAPEEYGAGHLPGAVNIPVENLTEYYDKLTAMVPLDATVVCYCRSVTCDQSENLAREMRIMGYKHVMVYKGGWEEWSQAGYSSEGSPPSK